MNKASSLIVLIVLGSLVADAVAQTNPTRGSGYNPPSGGTSGASSSSGGQSGGTSGRAQGGSSGGQAQGGSSGGQSQGGSSAGQSQQGGSAGGQSQGGTSGRAQGGSSGGQSQGGSSAGQSQQGGSAGGQSQGGSQGQSQGGSSGSQTGGTYQPYPSQQSGSQGGQGQQGPGQQQSGSQGGQGQQGPGQQQSGSQGGQGQQGPGQQQSGSQGGHGQQGPGQQQGGSQGGQGQQGPGQQQGGSQGGHGQQPQYPQYPSQPQYPQYPSQGQGQGQGGYSQSQTISQRPLLSVRSYERVELANLLRLPMSQSMDMQADSLTILAQGLRSASATLDVQVRGLSVAGPQLIRRSLSEVRVLLPIGTRLDDVEIISNDDVLIDSVSAQVSSSRYSQMGRPSSGQLLSLNISQSVRSSAIISLDQLVQQQLGLDLEGITIERVAVQAQSSRGISGSVQLQMNNRAVSEAKAISQVSRAIPLVVSSLEQVRSLDLIVRGDVIVTNIIIRVGQVRGGR